MEKVMKIMVLAVLFAVSATSVEASIEKALSASDANLGDHVTVTLTVNNTYGSDVKVEDELPNDLKYIPGTFEVSGSPATPTIDDNKVSTMIGPGPNTIEFDVQVVEVQANDVNVTNVARLYDPFGAVADSNSAVITLLPYEGFEKVATIEYEAEPNGVVSVGELVQWDLTITLPNNFAWDIENAVIKDNLGAELGLAGDGVDNDKDDFADEGGPGDLAATYNTLPAGSTLDIKTKGKTKKVQLKITGIDIAAGGQVQAVLGIFTDTNPGKGNDAPHQEYTSPGTYELNSGATVKFVAGDTGFQLSAHTGPIEVEVAP